MKKRIMSYFPMSVFLIIIIFYFMNFVIELGGSVFNLTYDKSAQSQQTVIDWAEKYPFMSVDEKATATEEKNQSKTFLGNVEDLITKIKASVEYHLKESFVLNRQLIEFNGAVNSVLGKNIVTGMESSVVQLKNGQLVQADESMSSNDYAYVIDEILEFADNIEKNDVPFIYVQMPNKVCKYDPQLPLGVQHHLNDQMDRTVKDLTEAGYPVVDLRENLNTLSDDYYSLFYNTDHHWKVETAFYAAEVIESYLNSNVFSGGNEKSILDRSNFHEIVYEKSFLGYLGRQVTLGNARPEDFTLLLPNDTIDYTISCPGRNLYKSGTFEDVLINWEMFDDDKGLYDKSYYDSLLYGNQAVTTIVNESVEDNSKILIIKDSFSLPMAMYLSTVYHEITLIDIRLNQGQFNGSVRAFVDEYRPDVVVLAMFPAANIAYRLE